MQKLKLQDIKDIPFPCEYCMGSGVRDGRLCDHCNGWGKRTVNSQDIGAVKSKIAALRKERDEYQRERQRIFSRMLAIDTERRELEQRLEDLEKSDVSNQHERSNI